MQNLIISVSFCVEHLITRDENVTGHVALVLYVRDDNSFPLVHVFLKPQCWIKQTCMWAEAGLHLYECLQVRGDHEYVMTVGCVVHAFPSKQCLLVGLPDESPAQKHHK